MATDHNFRIKNGLTIGSTEVIDSNGKLTAAAFGTDSIDKVHDEVDSLMTAGTGISLAYDDSAGTLTITNTYDNTDVQSYLTAQGIETGATADQTASEILTLLKTVDSNTSGLNADTLDGQQGSYYYAASNPNGYTNDQTAAEILTLLKTVDTNTSGLNADTLDGQQGTHYLNYGNFTNTPTIPSLSGYATETYVGNQISALVGTAGATLDTLGEIATALGNDAALNTTLVNSIATKLPLAGGTLTGATTINAGLSINRGSTSGALWFGTQNDKNHVLWNAYYGTDPVTKGSAGSGFDGIYWNAYRGIHIRGGLNGANNIIVAENTSGSGNNHTVKLYASNVKRFETTTTGAVIENTLLLGNYTDASKQGTLVLGGSTANKQAIIKCTNGNLHVDADGTSATYLNFYTGSAGTAFGQGAGGVAAWMGPDGDLWKGSADNTGSKYWHAGNDGSGSGLDADLLDGLQSAFAPTVSTIVRRNANGDISAREVVLSSGLSAVTPTVLVSMYPTTNQLVRTTPAAVAAGMGAWTSSNDGSGSGLDADLLDGQHGSHYLAWANVTGKPTIPTNNNQLTNGAGYTTNVGDVTSVTATSPLSVGNGGGPAPNIVFSSAAITTSTSNADGDFFLVHSGTTSSGNLKKLTKANINISGFNNDSGYTTYTANQALSTTNSPTFANLNTTNTGYVGIGDDVRLKDVSQANTAGVVGQQNTDRGYLTFGNNGTQLGRITTGALTWGGNQLWHAGNDGSGSGLDADTVDGVQGASFLRSDATDTATGIITLSNTGNHFSGHHYFDSFDVNGNHYPQYLSGSSNNGAQVNLRVQQSGTGNFDVLYIPNGSNNITWRGNKVWNAGNDGSGSGLDADLLDGQHGSYYAAASHVHSYLPLTGGTLTGNLAGTTAAFSGKVDFQGDAAIEGGSGYGVFKGYTGNNNHFIVVRGSVANASTLSITGAHQTTFVEHAENNDNTGWYFKSNQTGSYAEIARITRTGGMHLQGNKVWHAGNDGSGSGLDADLLDGNHASAFATSAQGTLATNALPKAGGTMSGTINFSDTNAKRGIAGTMGANDQWFVGGAATGSNAGYLEISTGDDGQTSGTYEYIYVRQYGPGSPLTGTLVRTAALLDNYGNTYFPGNVSAYYSDERLKTKTGNIRNAIEKVQSLSGFYYVENEIAKQHGYSTKSQQVGLSAQEVKNVLPEAVSLAPFDRVADEVTNDSVSKSGEDYLTVDYSRLVPLLIEAVKEQQEQIEELKNIINTILEEK